MPKKKIVKSVRKHLVKRAGHNEKYDERKVYASCYAACLANHLSEKRSEKVANSVCKDVNKWIKNKSKVDAHDIFQEIIKFLKKHNKDVAFMYETHMDIS